MFVAFALDGIVGRLGGEEFCVLTGGAVADAVECAEEVQRTTRALRFNQGTEEFGIPCSFVSPGASMKTPSIGCCAAPIWRCTKQNKPAATGSSRPTPSC